MAEKNILSKPFLKNFASNERDIFYVETKGRQEANNFLPKEGKTSADLDVYRKISQAEYQELRDKGEQDLKIITNTGEDIFLAKNAAIVDGKVTPTKLAPERVLRDPNQILSPSLQASQQSVSDNKLNNNSNIAPNKAPQNTPPPSTPINVRTSQLDINFGSSSILIYPNNMSPQQDRMEFTIGQYINRGINDVNSPNILALGEPSITKVQDKPSVFLPVTKINDTNTVNWQEDGLNEIQKGFANLSLEAMRPGGTGIINQGEELLGMLKDTPFGNLARLWAAGQAIGVGNLLTKATGAILNPNMELLFNGPVLRQFGFGFDLLSKNKNEAEQVKKIIKFFKENMAVRDNIAINEGITGSNSKNLFLNSPYLFGIRYLAGSDSAKTHRSIGKIKWCALQACNVDYTPMGSYMTFNDQDNTMFMYRINLQFKEVTPIYSSDYTEDHPIGY
jgi:hypothetical protein